MCRKTKYNSSWSCFLNQNTFNVGETVKAERSGVTSLLTGTTSGDRNITNQYTLNINHKPNYYDFPSYKGKKSLKLLQID